MLGIDRLLRPKSIAVIGGGTWCANVVEQCRKIGFQGDLWAVHPKRDQVAGLPTVERIEDLPHPPDASFIGINRDLTIEAVRALAAMGAGGAVCFASGFSEAHAETGDGEAKQAALLEAAGDLTILGPNCYGFVNYLDGIALWPDQHGGKRVDRGVAIITQSSNIAINLTMQARGLPTAYVITAGNQAQTSLVDIARATLRDDRVTALGLYVEGFGDLRALEALAEEARAASKPIVALKVGKSHQAQAATISHTASLAGSHAGAEALLKRLGIGQAPSLTVLLETLKILHVTGPLPSNRIASISSSGGEASLAADGVLGSGLEFPPLAPAQKDALREALGPKVALANPLDYHTYIWGDEDAMTAAFSAMMGGDLAMGCVILDIPRADRCDPKDWEPTIRAVIRTTTESGKNMAVLAGLPETMPEGLAERLISGGVVPMAGLDDAIAAMAIASEFSAFTKPAAPVLLPLKPADGDLLSEAEAKSELAAYGIRSPRSGWAGSEIEAADTADRIGYPVVLKGEGVAHKTEAGAVALNLGSRDEVLNAAHRMASETFLVEEMITGSVVDLLVGIVADPAHGYLLTLAAGGVLTELLQDSATLLLPASGEEIEAALQTLRIAPMLRGYRGAPAADMGRIVESVMAVQAYVGDAHPKEIEINPLMCGPNAAIAADALIRRGG